MTQIFFDNEKVWQITIDGNSFTTAYGKTHSYSLKKTTKSFDSEEKSTKEANKLIAKKVKSGYQKLRFDLDDSLQALCDLQTAQERKASRFSVHEPCSESFIKEVCKIKTLTDLTITAKDILPTDIGQLKLLEKLKIRGEALKYIPDEIGQLSKLNSLKIDYTNNLLSLPSTIGNLYQLKKLQISGTNISRLPDSIGLLEQLEELKINSNHQLRYLPKSIGNLSNLKELKIDALYNNYGPKSNTSPLVLPDEIGLLSNLEELSLESNNLTTLPNSFRQLKKLKELSLDYNAFKVLPSAIFQLSNLKELSLYNSSFKYLPLQFCLLKKLEDFSYSEFDNVIENVPEDLLYDGDVKAIQDYLIKNTNIETLVASDRQLLVDLRDALKQTTREAIEMSPPPSNREALVLSRKEAFEKFERGVRDRAYAQKTEDRLKELMLYIQGINSTVPTAHVDDEYYFGVVSSILAPIQDWNFIDHRILAFISQPAFYYLKGDYYNGYHEDFAKYIETQLRTFPQQEKLYLDIVQTVANYGLDELTLLIGILDELRYLPLLATDQSATSFGNYLLNYFEQKPDELVDLILKHKHVTRFVELMVLHNEKGLVPYLPKLVNIKEYKGYDGNKHIPFEALEVLCAANPIYKQQLLDLLSQTDCMSCIIESYRILFTCFPEEYAASTLEKVKETLKHISTKKNEADQYKFHWSLAETRWRDDTSFFIDWACDNFKKELKPALFTYVENTNVLDLEVIKTAVKHYGQSSIDIAAKALNMSIKDKSIAGHYQATFSILANLDYSKYYDKVWEVAQSKFPEVASTACVALSQQNTPKIITKAKELLTVKSIPSRRAGVLTLALINNEPTIALIRPLLSTEKNEDIRNIIVRWLLKSPTPISLHEAQERIASAASRGKLSKPIAKWLNENDLPNLYWRDKTLLSVEEIRFLLYRQKSIDSIELDFEAREVFNLIDPKTSGEFAKALWSLIQKNGGAKAKNRFAMAVVGALGDNQLIEALYSEATKGKNLNACAVLGLMNTLEAARTLDRIMQFFKLKYPNVRGAAERAFEAIADSMQLSIFELSDKMLPDLDFENLERKVQVGTDLYTAFITADFKLAYKSPSNKVVKSLSKADKSVKDALKNLAKTLKEAVKQFIPNLEFYLVSQRAWTVKEWTAFFLKNPIAFAAAQNLIWQTYDASEVPLDSLMITSKQTFINAQGQICKVDPKVSIRLAHPIQLNTQERTSWTKYIQQQKIKPPFTQLNRAVITATSELKQKTMDYRYDETKLDGERFKSKATKKGWKRGSVVDSGEISSYQKLYPSIGIQAILRTSNLNVQSFGEEVTLQEFYFVHLGSIEQGSYIYDEPRDESDNRLIPFGKVPTIVYSETIADLQTITSS